MADLSGFDASKVEPNTAFRPLPAGDYAAVIVASEEKATKAGNGSYLELRLQITQGEYKNRTIYDRLNLKNPNEQAVVIAKGTLSSICRAVGVLTPNDSSDLHNRPLLVKIKTREYQGEAQNEVKGYAELPADFAADVVESPETPW